jgi:hypothetical protein
MFSVKILTASVLLAAASRGLHAQAAGAAQEVKKSAQAAAQSSTPSAKPAAQTAPKSAPSTAATQTKAAQQPGTKPAQPTSPAGKAAPAAPQGASQPAKPAAQSGAKPAPRAPAKQTGAASQVANPAVKPQGKTAAKAGGKSKAKSSVKKQAANKPAPKKSAAKSTGGLTAETRIARRDPFESLIGRESGGGSPSGPLPAGKAGLQVSTLRLDGVVKAPNGMIAVVSNPQSRTYFLREGDQLYDGRVEKIAMDGVSFHEIGKDAFGKPVERQVNKRIYASAGEQQ